MSVSSTSSRSSSPESSPTIAECSRSKSRSSPKHNKKNKERKESNNNNNNNNNNHNNNNNNTTNSEKKKVVLFEQVHWYDIPCPHQECYVKGVRFDCHDKFKLHHEQVHCPRGENGDIDRAKDSLRWQCPVITTREIEGIEYKQRCNKISNSWYNYAGHITSHREIGHGWGCALPPQGKRKKTNRLHPTIPGLIVCGKRTSTKHHLLAHMNNVHKTYTVIDAVKSL